MVDGYRRGIDAAQKMPVGMLLMEYIVHAWDLAIATGQPLRFTGEEADGALQVGLGMLKPEYRGPGKAFGYEAPVSETADTLDRLVAFLGRDLQWQAPAK